MPGGPFFGALNGIIEGVKNSPASEASINQVMHGKLMLHANNERRIQDQSVLKDRVHQTALDKIFRQVLGIIKFKFIHNCKKHLMTWTAYATDLSQREILCQILTIP